MKLITTVLFMSLVTFASVGSARAQATSGFLEVQTRADVAPGKNLILDGSINHAITQRVGLSSFFLTAGGWAEAYAGPTLQWTHASVGLSVGGEQNGGTFNLRYGSMVWAGKDKFSFLGLTEANNAVFRGDDAGFWYHLNLRFQATDRFMIGLKDRRNNGFGPMVQAKVGSTNIWIAWTPLNLETLKRTPTMLLTGIIVIM